MESTLALTHLRTTFGYGLLKTAFKLLFLACLLTSCETSRPTPKSLDESDVDRPTSSKGDPCSRPREGCPCDEDGALAECGSIKEQRGSYLICWRGARVCEDGQWGECVNESLVLIPTSTRAKALQGLRLTSLGKAESCENLCDPECTLMSDTPDGLEVPDDLTVSPEGLTLVSSSSGGSCSDVNLTPSNTTVTITNIAASGAVTATPSFVKFNAQCSGEVPLQPNWTLDAYDRAVIDGSGELHVFSGIAGQLVVTASTAADKATANVNVRVKIGPNLVNVGTTADPGKTLYPYRNTVFPLDLPAPLVQWDSGPITPTQVQVALRYPAGSASPTFLYTQTFTGDPKQGSLNNSVPAWQVPQHIWSAFDRSVAGDPNGGEILIRRKTASVTYAEMKIPVKFANAAVRGTTYYTQYQRTLSQNTCNSQSCTYGGNNYQPGQTCPVGIVTHGSGTYTSQIRAINLSSPTAVNSDPFNNAGGCPVCHSVSADGSVFVSGNQGWMKPISGGIDDVTFANGQAKFVPTSKAPTYTGLSDEGATATGGDPYNQYERNGENSRGFSYAAISPDGSLVMQGPTFWGNTADTPSANNTQDAALKGLAGHLKTYFFVETQKPGVGVQFATTGPLPAHSWSNGQLSGSSGSLTVDGVALSTVGQAVLVKNESNQERNGIYSLTQVNPWRLSRRYDADNSSEFKQHMRVRVTDGVAMAGREFALTSPAGTISLNSSKLQFTEVTAAPPVFGSRWLTADVATTGPLTPGTVNFSNGTLDAGANGTLVVDGVTLTAGKTVLVQHQSNPASNGVYTVQNAGSSGSRWRLVRHTDANSSSELTPGLEVKVTGGKTHYNRAFYIAAPTSGTINVNATAITWALGGLPTMMVPQFSPDGTQVVYVNGDPDIAGGLAQTGWRRGLSILDFDPVTRTASKKRRLLNNWSTNAAGAPIKWPFFESDSRSIIYVESEPSEFCSLSDSDHNINVNNDTRRACFEASYGSMSPTTRGYWKGRLFSLDSENPSTTRAELSKLNDADDDGGADDATDGDRSYQPTVLPFSAGGYRWVIFASPRAYGNQFNAKSSNGTPTHFSCAASMLWMSAIKDVVADGTDRSNPAFLLPGQNIQKITSSNHFINERGYLVPSLCKDEGASCTTDDECCGALDSPPTQACRAPVDWKPDDGPPAKSCEHLSGTCNYAGESCSTSADCCNGVACVEFKCALPSQFEPATFTRDYTAECATGQHPNWQLFSFHLTTGSDSKIAFVAQSAENVSELNSAKAVNLGESNDTRVAPATPAFLDVGGALEGDRVSRHQRHLRITTTLVPSSDGRTAPVLHDWEMRYTCEDGE